MFYWQQLWQQSLIAFLIKVAKFVNFAATIFNGQWSQISRFHGHKSKWHFCPSQPWNSITANLVFCEFMVFVGSPLSNCCWTEYYIPALNLNIWKGGSNIACLYVRICTHMYVEQAGTSYGNLPIGLREWGNGERMETWRERGNIESERVRRNGERVGKSKTQFTAFVASVVKILTYSFFKKIWTQTPNGSRGSLTTGWCQPDLQYFWKEG